MKTRIPITLEILFILALSVGLNLGPKNLIASHDTFVLRNSSVNKPRTQFVQAPKPKIPYKNWDAISYAKKYCGQKLNSCGKYFEGDNLSDCAHFIAHCLAVGGIKLKNPDPNNQLCPDKLPVRNKDIVDQLRALSNKLSNVKEIGLSDAIIGDYGFLDSPIRPYHAFMICKPVDMRNTPPDPVEVYAHSTQRCCEAMDAKWKQWYSTSFRIED